MNWKYISAACGVAALWMLSFSGDAHTQINPAESWGNSAVNQYIVTSNVVYSTPNNYENKLDLYRPIGDAPAPTLIYFHGGGWVQGNKETSMLTFIPFLRRGWAVVNVEYREAHVALAPAAVEDCRCALRWVLEHVKDAHFDPSRIVVMGDSAGGHLALMTGMLTGTEGLDRTCVGNEPLRVAAIVDWYGMTDVTDLLSGTNVRSFAKEWFGNSTGGEELAKRLSPINLVRAGLPPIFMIHGDADPTVPYAQSVRFHESLDAVHVPNELITINGGKHGGFSKRQMDIAYAHIWSFLGRHMPPSH